MNDEGKPFRSVAERSFETKSVTTTPKTITVNNKPAETSERNGNEIPVAKNIVIIAIKVGNLPLQGTKLFVTVAIIRSLGDSIIRQPVTPQALHPNPINIVRDCFPLVPDLAKNLSILNATLGKYPKSSKSVNSGKKIAIGGSITATTHERVLNIPSINKPFRNGGDCNKSKSP